MIFDQDITLDKTTFPLSWVYIQSNRTVQRERDVNVCNLDSTLVQSAKFVTFARNLISNLSTKKRQ